MKEKKISRRVKYGMVVGCGWQGRLGTLETVNRLACVRTTGNCGRRSVLPRETPISLVVCLVLAGRASLKPLIVASAHLDISSTVTAAMISGTG